MVKTLKIAEICCPVRLFRRNNCCFLNEKISQSETENDKKKQNFPFFKVFMQFLSNIRQTSYIGLLKSQHGTNLLSSSIFRRVNCSFQVEKYLRLAPTEKTQSFPIFKVFMQFLSNFR